MPALKGFQLTSDDVLILHHVHELRVAHIDHLAALTTRSHKALARRLFKLTERRFLACMIRRPEKHLYAIGVAGIAALIEHGYARQDLAAKRLRHGEMKDIFLRHLLLVVDIHVRLVCLAEHGPIKLAGWREGPAWQGSHGPRATGRGVYAPRHPAPRRQEHVPLLS
jgi:hypothetical protein